ncbi:MAG: oligopeptide transporter, OPT family, partial [Clostridia bacterium]|nr:oligopeptide transporter, OPT family [Clostridia bacterium]
AAGSIFTLPVLFLWAAEGKMNEPSMLEISAIAICGGLLGVFFMIPLRNALIVKEHGILPYPEGAACAEVLLAGEEGGSSAITVFTGMGIAGVFKFLVDGLKVVPGVITAKISALKTEVSTEIYPALIGVGYICGPSIASFIFAGGILGWLVFIPCIVIFGAGQTVFPGTETIEAIYAAKGASAIWGLYIRYIGAGAVAAGGAISLIKSFPLIIATVRDTVKGMKSRESKRKTRTNEDLDMRFILCAVVLLIITIWLLPVIPVTLLGATIIVILGFFFSTVASRMVGLVGSSNNPVSGMTIATLLFTTLILKVAGDTGMHGGKGAIAISSVICIIAAVASDTSQDLKAGYLLGATPKKQQIGEIIGSVTAALVIGGVLFLLSRAWSFGTPDLPAPQATLMKMIVEGVMGDDLPWGLVLIGAFVAIVIELLKVPVLPVAIGLYLPLELSACIMIGGLTRRYSEKKNKDTNGILFCSGMIAGEGLVGLLLAVFAVTGISGYFDFSNRINTGTVGSVIVLILIVLSVLKSSAVSIKEK